MAKEVKRHESPKRRPPRTAANLVDFRRQIATMIGELTNDMQRHKAPNQAGKSDDVFQIEIVENC